MKELGELLLFILTIPLIILAGLLFIVYYYGITLWLIVEFCRTKLFDNN